MSENSSSTTANDILLAENTIQCPISAEGNIAFQKGEALKSNPHPTKTAARERWEGGWLTAYDKHAFAAAEARREEAVAKLKAA